MNLGSAAAVDAIFMAWIRSDAGFVLVADFRIGKLYA